MLDQETKRRIDSARDILVGKVPDPKSQVEQITIALIYKFMDDLDKASEELGGEPQFFTDGFKQYSWSKLMDSKLGGQDRLNLYVEAITKFGTNKNLPQLFRDIFKGAVLPYRDPNVLHLFLKAVNGFNYDHSENLGNAFEYLLSVMGSQGDAGQFRTSRHIIDFIVEVVDPKKDETVLDPACGTAGFLISAYKHILERHGGEGGAQKKEKQLTPDERQRLMSHFVGYDISPDMVRLSLVNMYLHGFPSPKIFEYDSLGSEDRWDERYDVILANPPFMTPKGGVRPHRRFSIQANRTEVLFVDYIAEHLTHEGRAGIIVPEGIIFKGDTAYKSLRKMLVEEGGLYAVISLPAGVFKPYSNVKTSILLLDKKLATQAADIVFLKIENDGFDLGARRVSQAGNQLPAAAQFLRDYKNYLETNQKQARLWPRIAGGFIGASAVSKEEIAKDEDFSLLAERYKEAASHAPQKWPLAKLGDVCEINPKKSQIKDKNVEVSFVPMSDLTDRHSKFTPKQAKKITDVYKGYTYFAEDDVLLAKITPCFENGKSAIAKNLKNKIGFGSTEFIVFRAGKQILPEWIYYFVASSRFVEEGKNKMTGSAGQKRLNIDFVRNYRIPLPPVEVQKEIIGEIETKQAAIDSAKELIRSLERERGYFGRTLEKINETVWVELGEICDLEYGYTAMAKNSGDARLVRITDIGEDGKIIATDQKFVELTDEARQYLLKKGDVLVARTGATYGKTALVEESQQAIFASYLIKLSFDKKKILPEFYWIFAQSDAYWDQAKKLVTGGGQPQFNANVIKKIMVPLLPIDVQTRLIAEMKNEDNVIVANRRIVDLYQGKIDQLLNQV